LINNRSLDWVLAKIGVRVEVPFVDVITAIADSIIVCAEYAITDAAFKSLSCCNVCTVAGRNLRIVSLAETTSALQEPTSA
jgi:hypothetical protein